MIDATKLRDEMEADNILKSQSLRRQAVTVENEIVQIKKKMKSLEKKLSIQYGRLDDIDRKIERLR